MENKLELKTIHELCSLNFHIPSYQRGYRWKEYEVMDLLNDIFEFRPKQIGNTDNKTWYCLQPIVVKEFQKEESLFEVIDGQQRLTTIYLILHYLNQDFKVERQDKLFSIKYETRETSQCFLENICSNIDQKEYNIDYFYIISAYETITKWFEEKETSLTFDKNEFRSKFKFHSKIIWYQSYEENPIDIFTRINIGKIPLTNAELIKALFLNCSNFDSSESEKIRQRQFEIANEWDQIENSLQNDKFWFFLSKKPITTNRIEIIFNLMNKEKDETDAYSTFRYFAKKLNNHNSTLESIWLEIKHIFQRFTEWFSERELYHKIGYLLYVDAISINKLLELSLSLSKNRFKNKLDFEIEKNLKGINLEDLQYGDKEVKSVLLLYNILTMLKSTKDNSYFPFDLFKIEKWDIEHISSIKDKQPDKDDRNNWLKDAINFIDIQEGDGQVLMRKAKICICRNDQEFTELFEDIVAHFNSKVTEGDLNDITNLTLLDSKTNRGYKNAVFPLKRKTIIEKDKQGVFIPLCTKNVFLKYFSEYPPKISFWTNDDRNNYRKDLTETLSKYIS